MYDLIIIGMGISGISAAIYAKKRDLKVLMLENSAPGGTLNQIPQIDNYPGFENITGPDFAMNLFNKVNNLQIEYHLEKVTDVILEDIKTIKTTNNVYQSKYLLIATGRKPNLLKIKNIEKYLGQGVSTCALCDGTFYKNKDIAVIGGGNSALSESIYLSNLAKTVYLIHRRSEFRGTSSLINKVKNIPNIKIIYDNEVTSLITSKNTLTGIKLKDQTLKVSGIFIYIGSTPNTDFLKNTSIKLDNGYILVNKNYETNIPGVYASGDVIKKDIYQLITAASEGATVGINISQN